MFKVRQIGVLYHSTGGVYMYADETRNWRAWRLALGEIGPKWYPELCTGVLTGLRWFVSLVLTQLLHRADDDFSFGCTLARLSTGDVDFTGESTIDATALSKDFEAGQLTDLVFCPNYILLMTSEVS